MILRNLNNFALLTFYPRSTALDPSQIHHLAWILKGNNKNFSSNQLS